MTDKTRQRTGDPVVRPLTEHDEIELRRLFRETLVMGRPLPFPLADGGRYEALCLDWYLAQGRRDAVVVDAGGQIVGFALVCTDQAAFRRWVRARAARYAVYSVLTLITYESTVSSRSLPSLPPARRMGDAAKPGVRHIRLTPTST